MSLNPEERGKKIVEQCHPKIQTVVFTASRTLDCDIRPITGYRGKKRQNNRYRQGLSKVKYPNSMHNKRPSMAVDIAPYFPKRDDPIPWDNPDMFLFFAGHIIGIARTKGIPLISGTDWDADLVPVESDKDESFFDGLHFELHKPG